MEEAIFVASSKHLGTVQSQIAAQDAAKQHSKAIRHYAAVARRVGVIQRGRHRWAETFYDILETENFFPLGPASLERLIGSAVYMTVSRCWVGDHNAELYWNGTREHSAVWLPYTSMLIQEPAGTRGSHGRR